MIRYALFFLLALSPLPLASARPVWQWAWIVFIGLMCLGALVTVLTSRKVRPSILQQALRLPKAALLLFSLFIIWGFLQAILAIPEQPRIGTGFQFISSLAPEKTLKVSLFFLAHMMLFILVFVCTHSRERAALFFNTIAVITTLYALYGLIIFLSGNEYILWMEKEHYLRALTSTFVNSNNYAAYTGMGLITTVACGAQRYVNTYRGQPSKAYIREILDGPGSLYLIATLILLSALMLTGSRAGVVTTSIGLLTFFLIWRPDGLRLKTKMRIGFLVVLVLVAIALISGERFTYRITETDLFTDERFDIYPLVWDSICTFPLSGTGLGTFDEGFRLVRTVDVRKLFLRAHSDYLEITMTAGLPATILLILSIGFVVQNIWKHALSYKTSVFAACVLAVAVQLGIHSAIDFPLQIPAISLLFVTLIAIASARARKQLI